MGLDILKAKQWFAPMAVAVLITSHAAPAAQLAIHIHSERAMFQVLISPGTVGIDGFVLQLMSGDGKKLPVKEATLYLSLPERGIEPLKRKAKLGSDGYWHVRIDARADFQQITLEDDFDVPARSPGR